MSTALNAIRESLREVGLSSRQIERLERRNFPYDQVRILVQDKLEDLGYSPSRAERIGREVALQAGRWREYGERATRRDQDEPARLEALIEMLEIQVREARPTPALQRGT